MKKLTLATLMVLSTAAFASRQDDELAAAFSTWYIFMSPAATTLVSSPYQKNALEMAQEDAVKFVANKGAGKMSPALRTAIEEINAKLAAAEINALSDLDAANMVVFINTINSQK